MGSNYINENASITTSIQCINDSTVGYSADFSVNGDVNGWDFYDGVHSYGCWDGFLFGTVFDQASGPTYARIGRSSVIQPIDARTHYFIRLTMKYNPYPRDPRGVHPLPTRGKIQWRTLSNTLWDSDKEQYFDLEADSEWHTYVINMGVKQFWQGDINDLRVWPVTENAADGDEFFIRAIDIFSIENYACRNTACEKYYQYSHPCPWIGARATLTSAAHEDIVSFYIEDNSEIVVNINNYGPEIINLPEINNASGQEVANALAKQISYTDIGGYAEVFVEYTDDNKFKIYSGTVNSYSSVEVEDGELARLLKFYDSHGTNTSVSTLGEDPVNGFSPLSSFKIKSHQLFGLFDNNSKTQVLYNPFNYSVEGGRSDWLESSLGLMSSNVGTIDTDASGQTIREYYRVSNSGKTIVDFNHPFNASGRIKNIWVQCTLDEAYARRKQETERKAEELSGGKVLIVRPHRDGTMTVIHSWDIPDRDPNRGYSGKLYSTVQEALHIEVDVFVNKGDLIAVYNAHMYIGKTISGSEVDARYYQVDGLVSGTFSPGRLYGDGASGLLMYARGDDTQKRLYIEMDLKNRYNIDDINLYGEAQSSVLEYNLARCLDINWQVDLFGLQHWTHHLKITDPNSYHYQRPNTYYGLDNLNDGVYIVNEGVACDSYSITYDNSTSTYNLAAGPGIVPVNPRYFWVNGDEEWLGIWLHAQWFQFEQTVTEFSEDPIAIYVYWPYLKTKKIYKSKIYFKEKSNFKSFALSTYGGPYYNSGNADDIHYNLIPEYTKVILDRKEYYEGGPGYGNVDKYLFVNPNYGGAILEQTGRTIYEWDPIYSDLREDFGSGFGYFTTRRGEVANYDEFEQARNLSWNILEHQWDPIECKGFRFYCNLHQSTKITEMEIYGVADDVGSSLAGSIVVTHSDYGDIWWPTESSQESEDLVNILIGDSPRYLRFEIIPVTETRYDDIVISVKTEDLYAGTKGCEYVELVENAKTDSVNKSQIINVKNTYGAPYDLYVDINKEVLYDEGVVYFSRLNSALSINNPSVGPDGVYYKLLDYRIENQDYNVAINCPAYGLKNLVDGATAYYSRNWGNTWYEYGKLAHGQSVDFSNLYDVDRSVLTIPIVSRSRYWRFVFPYWNLVCPQKTEEDVSVVEIEMYFEGERIYPNCYHDEIIDPYNDTATRRAPHISNDSLTGSYYNMNPEYELTLDLGYSGNVDTIIFYFNSIACGNYLTDETIGLYLTGEDFNDRSYHNANVSITGNVVVDTTVSGLKLDKGSFYFDGSSYVSVPYNSNFNLNYNYFSFDFFVKFDEVPSSTMVKFIESEFGGHYLRFYYQAGRLYMRFFDDNDYDGPWSPSPGIWYHVAFGRGDFTTYGLGEYGIVVDGGIPNGGERPLGLSTGTYNRGAGGNTVKIGQNLKGHMSHVRWCGGGTTKCYTRFTRVYSYSSSSFNVPTETAPHKYRCDVYVSNDNSFYGLYNNLDFYGTTTDSIQNPGSVLDTQYYEYFAIDLGARYDLSLVRNYGNFDVYNSWTFSIDSDTSYSADDVNDVTQVNFNSDSSDARWIRINMASWDGTNRTIYKVGVYPDITRSIAPGGGRHNSSWDSLGNNLTNYSESINIALDATVSGSSTYADYVLSNITNGIISDDIYEAWLAENGVPQWVSIDLGAEYEIYRVKIYHGFDTENYSSYYAQNYLVQISNNGINYTNIFDINNNTSQERTHDLADPVTARFVRIYIESIHTDGIGLRLRDPDTQIFSVWKGACLREVEIYEYYGYSTISSENYPIVAVNLKDQFYIGSKSLEGLYTESSDYDWDDSDSAFAWSDSVSSDPQHVRFSEFGATPNYEQWVAIKRNTATWLNPDPIGGGTEVSPPPGLGVDYLKHVRIHATTKENPINYPWWWTSTISTLSRDYSKEVVLCTNSLKIDYPASSAMDTVQFIEGSDWGIDSNIAYRDGLSFRWYIDDVDKLDLSAGYIFFGGTDGTASARPVIYYWNIATFSGALNTGWNSPFFRFKDADSVIYNTDAAFSDEIYPTMREYTTWHTAGISFRGKGSAFSMNIDGIVIKRNHFQDASRYDYGLYLANQDYLDVPIGALDLSAGAIEFWLRPDYTAYASDVYNRVWNRGIFHIGNNSSDVFGLAVCGTGFNLYYGNVSYDMNIVRVEGLDSIEIDGLYHIAVTYSNNARNTGDGSSIKVFVNAEEVISISDPWIVRDNKAFKFCFGAKPPLAVLENTNTIRTGGGDAVFSNLRIYNYCKTDFKDSLTNNYTGTISDRLKKASEMIEISRDNVTFYKVDGEGLPFYYPLVANNTTIPIYFRTTIPEGLTGKEKRTAGIVVQWDIGI